MCTTRIASLGKRNGEIIDAIEAVRSEQTDAPPSRCRRAQSRSMLAESQTRRLRNSAKFRVATHRRMTSRGWPVKRSGRLMSRVRDPAANFYVTSRPRLAVRKTPVAAGLLNQGRQCDLKSSLSSGPRQRRRLGDGKKRASHSDPAIGFLGSDLAAPKMHCWPL